LLRHLAFAILPIAATGNAQQAEVTRYGVAHGLPQSMVNHVLQDRDGFIWLGTGDGLARFDGHRFVVYKHDPRDSASLSHNSIWGLAERDAHSLWVGTRSGLDVLDRRTERFARAATGTHGASDGCWKPLLQHADSTLFYSPLSNRMVAMKADGPAGRPQGHAESYAMHADQRTGIITQVLWPATLLTILPGGGERLDRLPVAKDERITALLPWNGRWLVLSDQSAWTWSSGQGREPLPPDTRTWMERPSSGKHAVIDGHGRIQVAISGTGVAVLDEQLEVLQVHPLLPAHERPLDITTIVTDRQGNTWVGTDGKGVFKIAPQRIKFGRCMPGQGLPWEPDSWFVRGFAQWDAHQVLVNLYQGGFAVFDERSNTLRPLELPPATRKWTHKADLSGPLVDRRGTLWLRDQTRVFAMAMRSGRSLLAEGWTPGSAMARSADGSMVVLDQHGLWTMRYRENGIQAEAHPSTQLKRWMDSTGMVPNRMTFDAQDRLFLCQNLVPITVWKDDRRIAAGPFHKDVRFTSIHPAEHGDLWMTSNDGLYLLDGKELSVKRHWTVHDGLPDQFTYGMLPQGDGSWWIATNKGLAHFHPRTDNFQHYGPADGLQSDEFNSNAFFRSSSGRLYFGGINGFNHFTPGAITIDPDTARAMLIGLAAQDSTLDLSAWDGVPVIELPHGRNHLRIELAVLEFTAPERNRYRYRIKGYVDWSEHPADRPIVLANMPAGSYALEVAGINGDGLAGSPRELLHIHVPLPFWASPWAFVLLGALAIALAGGTGFLIYRQRLRRRMERTEQEMKELRIRARVAQDLHDDLGSGLARITALSRTAERNMDRGDDVCDPVGKLATLSQELMHDLRDVVWVNDPRGGELAEVLLRIRDHALDLFEGSGATCAIDFPKPLPERTIGPTAKRDLYLIAKEAAHNAFKYSGATAITIRFQLGPDGFRLELSDNGRGMAEGAQSKGHGLRNMRDRAAEIGCSLEAGNHSEGGFHLVLAGPVVTLDL